MRGATDEARRDATVGLAYGIAAYGFWGIAPLYFKLLAHVPAIEVLAHRITWSVVFVGALIAAQRRWLEVVACVRSWRVMRLLLASAVFISVNWFTYFWAVANGQVIPASLGYFINPLLAVAMRVVILRERLRTGQALAIAIAACAVVAMIVLEGRVPVVSLVLAGSFATYGLLRKQAVVAPMVGLLVETVMLVPLALLVVGRQVNRTDLDARTWLLLASAGIVTAVPLIWFAAAARRLRLSTLGFLQYLAPTGQFLLGIFHYHEPFDRTKLACYGAIWIALLIFTVDSVWSYRKSRATALAVTVPE
jgi:chloramphenicol-sensitive protein RarD